MGTRNRHTSIAGPLVLAAAGWGVPAEAQRTAENTVREAEDGFGKSVGSESIGIYAGGEVRGFSATDAGNNRIEGIYFDRQAQVTNVIVRGSTVRLGLTAFGYPLPAPTGIVDLELRRAGAEPVVSVQLNSGDYLGADLVVDAALPVTDRFGVNLDLGLYDDEYVSGAGGWFISYGGVARWHPVDQVELTGFFGRYDYGDEEQAPVIYTAGAHLPGRIERRRYFGQDWADSAGHAQNYGGLVNGTFGDWQVSGGVFDSRLMRDKYHSAYYSDVDRKGVGQSLVIGGRDQVSASTSGELRVSRTLAEGSRRHRWLASVRARAVDVKYGGFDIVDLGPARTGITDQQAPPDFDYGELTRDRVSQTSTAVGYELRWLGIGELNLGLARTDYRKRIARPDEPVAEEQDRPWLWNAALAITATERLTLYGAATRGLEESGLAPANAANRNQALPALRTRQQEVGLRYAFSPRWRLVAAAFEIEKPYFEIDRTDGVFRQLGQVSHRGIEASLSAQPVDRLSLVAGAVWMQPRVSGQAVEDGRLGRRPIGRVERLVDVSADYQLPWLAGGSLDARVVHEGPRVADAADTLEIPARTLVDLGARYRTRIGGVPTLFRAQVKNVSDVFGWRVSGGGGFTLLPGRRVTLSVTADF